MSPLLRALAVGLLVMTLPPILSAIVLWRHRHSESLVLRERWLLSILLAAQALIVAVLVLNRLLRLGLEGEGLAIPLALILLLVNAASLRWLWQWWTGRLLEERDWPETVIERQDRIIGDERRRLQAEAEQSAPSHDTETAP